MSILNVLKSLNDHILKIHDKNLNKPPNVIKIVYNVEDKPFQSFADWFSCTMQDQKLPSEEISEENCVDIIHDISMKILNVGHQLQNGNNPDELTK